MEDSIKKIEGDFYVKVTFIELSIVKSMAPSYAFFKPNNFCLEHFCLLGLVFEIGLNY